MVLLNMSYLRSWYNACRIVLWQSSVLCTVSHMMYFTRTSMMMSSSGNIFRVTCHLCGEITGHRWIPRTKASDAELWSFSLICAWINGWVNNREDGDLRRHRANYDVIVTLWRKTKTVSHHTTKQRFALELGKQMTPLWLNHAHNSCDLPP